MRSYEAARGLFSFLAVLAWIVIVAGGLVAFFGFLLAYQAASSGYGLGGDDIVASVAAALPGVSVVLFGVLQLALAQIGRAGVDTAEYTQQMLKIARDQLEVSRQALQGPNAPSNSFSDAVSEKPEAGSAYENLSVASREAERGGEKEGPAIEDASGVVENYRGQQIAKQGERYQVGEQVFETLDAARKGVDVLLAEAGSEPAAITQTNTAGKNG